MNSSNHFQLSQLAPSVFAAVCGQRGAGIGNAGLIDLGDRTLVFDTFLTPRAAADLLAISLDLTGRQPDLVINSHYHNDHTWGNQIFVPQALILSSEGTRDLITTHGQEEYDWYREHSAGRLEELRAQYDQTADAAEKENLITWLDYYGGLVEAFPTLKICLPQMTFAERLTIYGSSRRADLYTFENGHTGSDTILHLPDDQILFAGDLLFVQCHPFLSEANPFELIAILERIKAMSFSTIVPGHGPAGTKEDVNVLIEYVRFCIDTAERMSAEGHTDEEAIAGLEIPERYDQWIIPHFFQMNIGHLLKLLAEQ